MRKNLAAAMVAVLLAALIPFSASSQQVSASAEQASARDVIEGFHATLLTVMKEADSLGFEGRKALLTPDVERSFDLPLMTKLIVGRSWEKMTEVQRARLVDAFTTMTISIYADRFDGYSGQTFEVVGVTETRRKGRLVRTQLVGTDGDRIDIDYLLLRGGDGWRIVDIYLKRISELATRSSEYGSVIRRQGVDALINSIEAKIALLDTENGAK